MKRSESESRYEGKDLARPAIPYTNSSITKLANDRYIFIHVCMHIYSIFTEGILSECENAPDSGDMNDLQLVQHAACAMNYMYMSICMCLAA